MIETRTDKVKLNTYTLQEWEDLANSGKVHIADPKFVGCTIDEAKDMFAHGWPKGLQDAMRIAEGALTTVNREVELPSFQANWLMTGCEVDVGRYLQGVPECMIEYEPIKVSKVGKVVTLCASICTSAAVPAAEILKRGAAVVALVLALEQCQHATEVYADFSVMRGKVITGVRVLVKGAHDELDPARLAYILGHPASQRFQAFAVGDNIHPNLSSAGSANNAAETLPEGTIYLPCVLSTRDGVKDVDRFVIDHLRKIGLVD